MVPIMLSAIQGWSAGTCKAKNQVSSGGLTWEVSLHDLGRIWTHIVPGSKNPVKV
jgi:hypothetical protein